MRLKTTLICIGSISTCDQQSFFKFLHKDSLGSFCFGLRIITSPGLLMRITELLSALLTANQSKSYLGEWCSHAVHALGPWGSRAFFLLTQPAKPVSSTEISLVEREVTWSLVVYDFYCCTHVSLHHQLFQKVSSLLAHTYTSASNFWIIIPDSHVKVGQTVIWNQCFAVVKFKSFWFVTTGL